MPRKKLTNAPVADATLDSLAAENAALKAQNDQILDGLIEMQDKLAALESAQTGAPAKTVQKQQKQAELDAELDALVEEFKDYPSIEVFARRVVVGQDANTDIRLKGEPPLQDDPKGERRTWKLRWFNFGKEGRAQACAAEGYVKVQWAELQDDEAITTDPQNRTMDQYVRKGERGQEVLCKIPMKLYAYKKKRDEAARQGLLTSESKLRDHLANKTAGAAGERGENADQAGTFIHGQTFMTIDEHPTERFTA